MKSISSSNGTVYSSRVYITSPDDVIWRLFLRTLRLPHFRLRQGITGRKELDLGCGADLPTPRWIEVYRWSMQIADVLPMLRFCAKQEAQKRRAPALGWQVLLATTSRSTLLVTEIWMPLSPELILLLPHSTRITGAAHTHLQNLSPTGNLNQKKRETPAWACSRMVDPEQSKNKQTHATSYFWTNQYTLPCPTAQTCTKQKLKKQHWQNITNRKVCGTDPVRTGDCHWIWCFFHTILRPNRSPPKPSPWPQTTPHEKTEAPLGLSSVLVARNSWPPRPSALRAPRHRLGRLVSQSSLPIRSLKKACPPSPTGFKQAPDLEWSKGEVRS